MAVIRRLMRDDRGLIAGPADAILVGVMLALLGAAVWSLM